MNFHAACSVESVRGIDLLLRAKIVNLHTGMKDNPIARNRKNAQQENIFK
jgi:uncharacterized protein YunC (DUF1805 family)